jgi:hypothetical protein
MSLDPLTSIFNLGQTAIERIWPDANKRAEEMRKLQELKQRGDVAQLNAHVQLMLAQMQVNKAEAGHASLMVAGWRPFIGWVGGFSMAYQFIVYPLLTWLWSSLIAAGLITQGMAYPPVLDTGALFMVVTGMLGVGAMRSFDKKNNTDTKVIL